MINLLNLDYMKMQQKTMKFQVVKLTDGTYRVAVEGETGVEIEAGVTEIKGLGNGTYYLVETVLHRVTIY